MKRAGAIDITDVARAAGVSPATVSRVFNHPDLVRPDTAAKIRRAADALGYIRNRAASAIHGARSGAVGLIAPTIDNAIFSDLIQAFSDVLQEADLSLLIATHGYDLEAEHRMLRKLLEHRVDGVALIGLSHHQGLFDLLAARRTPVVAMWSHADDAPIACVGSDNEEAGALAAGHLLSLGHRRVATIFPPLDGNDRAEGRRAGALSALAAAGAAPTPGWRLTARYHLAEAKAAAASLLAAPERPTAILCGNDVIARGAVAAAMDGGFQAGRDVSVTGIGDFHGSAELPPPLTTVRIDARQVGARAAETLLARMADPDAPLARLKVPLTLMARATAGPPPR